MQMQQSSKKMVHQPKQGVLTRAHHQMACKGMVGSKAIQGKKK